MANTTVNMELDLNQVIQTMTRDYANNIAQKDLEIAKLKTALIQQKKGE